MSRSIKSRIKSVMQHFYRQIKKKKEGKVQKRKEKEEQMRANTGINFQ